MGWGGAALWLLAAPAVAAASLALQRDAEEATKLRPVVKVVRILQDMGQQLNKEMEDDKEVYDKLLCWCQTNEQEKQAALDTAEATIVQLKSSIEEYSGKIGGMKVSYESTLKEYQSDYEQLQQAIALRMKENKEFHKREAELIVAIKSSKDAIVILSKHHPQLAQLRAASQFLQRAGFAKLASAEGVLSADQEDLLKSFLVQAPKAESLLDVQGFQSYVPASGQVFGILKQMKETFEQDLRDMQEGEKQALSDFMKLKAAKEEELRLGKKMQFSLEASLAEAKDKYASMIKELKTNVQIVADTKTFLLKLRKQCEGADADYVARRKGRFAEIAAVTDTINFLNSDDAFRLFDKTVNSGAFLQIAAEGQEAMKTRTKVVALLRRTANRKIAPAIALLVVSAQLDAFTKVKEKIATLKAELKKQQAGEVETKNWCDGELNKNQRANATAIDKKEQLETKIADLKSQIEKVTDGIKANDASIAEMQKQMKKAGDTREAENADYQETVTDQRLTQAILKKALDRMKEVYFLQKSGAPHIEMSNSATDPGNGPARFNKYDKSSAGSGVLAMIEKIIADSVATENLAMKSEQDAQTAYESFMNDSNAAILQLQEATVGLKVERAKARETLSFTKLDYNDNQKDLAGLASTNADLHGDCDYILANFETRQSARSAEMDALAEAAAILSGMK